MSRDGAKGQNNLVLWLFFNPVEVACPAAQLNLCSINIEVFLWILNLYCVWCLSMKTSKFGISLAYENLLVLRYINIFFLKQACCLIIPAFKLVL